jgi:hypothetical protein
MRRLVLALAAALGMVGPAAAEHLPPLQLVRPDEDYSALKDPELRTGLEAKLKYIPLGDGLWLSLGGEARERLDVADAARFGIGAQDDSYVLQRLLVHADLHLGDQVRAYVELGDHSTFSKKPPLSVSDKDGADVQNAFVDVLPDPALRIRAGRQELMLNPQQRFVSVREGPNVRQSFDGIRATWTPAGSGWRVEAFAVHPVRLAIAAFDDASDRTQDFWGVYVARTFTSRGGRWELDGYGLELDRDAVRFGAVSGDERRRSFGLRLAGQAGAWDLDWEGIAQTGSFAGRDIRAWGLGLDTGYTLQLPWMPRLGLRLDAASGDSDPRDGRLETFNPLFPKGAYFNESALTSWANLTAPRASLRVRPRDDLTLEASVSPRWRTFGHDAVYLQPAIPIPQTLTNPYRRVGTAFGFDASWKATRNIVLMGELVRQTAGPAITAAGGRATDFAMLIVQYRF